MKCPNCEYQPNINEYDYCDGPGRFFEVGIEARQEQNSYSRSVDMSRSLVYACPSCGLLFIDVA